MAILNVKNPHFDLPFRFKVTAASPSPTVGTVEQDTLDDIADCVEVILRYPRGFRPERPSFGIDEVTFRQQPVNTSDIQKQVGVFEPRSNAIFSERPDLVDLLIEHLTIEVTGGTQNA